VRSGSLWQRLLGVGKTTLVERVDVEEDLDEDPAGVLIVVRVRPSKGARRRCGRCGRRCAGYDAGRGRRRWRALDLGAVRAVIEADAPRVVCPEHGVVVAGVPWARHDAGHTRMFDDTVAWLATACAKTAVVELMRVAWRTVGSIAARVWADGGGAADRLAGLRRIGIDEISFRRGHKYLTIVVDHDSGRLLWAAEGRDTKTLDGFFDALGDDRAARLTHVTADAAEWIATVVARRAPAAIRCADAFHIVAWATDALDVVRRKVWNEARGGKRGTTETSKALKQARYALWKNPENLTDRQTAKLDWIAKTNPLLYRAYLLKEGLRAVFAIDGEDGIEALDSWIGWARRCRIPAFVELARRIVRQRDAIIAALRSGLSNARIESANTRIRLIIRRGFGFHSADAIIALAMLQLAGHRPVLPGRPT
jgi:transposase